LRTKCRHPQKKKARHAGRRQRPHADPLVGPGDPPCRDTARATTDQTPPCHCVVALATSSPGRRTPSAHQTKRATVVLVRIDDCEEMPRRVEDVLDVIALPRPEWAKVLCFQNFREGDNR